MDFTSYIRHVVWRPDAPMHGYPYDLPAVRDVEALRFDRPVVYLVGENGTGKSTLIEALAVLAGFNPEGGSMNLRFETQATHSPLYAHLKMIRGMRRPHDGYFLRAESFYNVASAIDRADAESGGMGRPIIESYGGKSLHKQSHGESFFALLQNRFGTDGLYILDEPEAALSPMRQMAMLCLIHDLVRHGSQFIIATHAPIVMAYPDARLYQCTARGIEEVAYDDVEHVRLYRQFLRNTDGMLEQLLGPDE